MKGIILAAGFGTRLRPLTDFLPKPLLPVAGEANLVRLIRHLHSAGIDDIRINLHHLRDRVPEILKDAALPPVRITWFHEPEILGTGGGIRQMMDDSDDALFVVMNGDILFKPDIAAMIARHQQRDALATMVVRPSPDAEKLGAVGLDDQDRVVRLVYGGDPSATRLMMFTGVHVLSAEMRSRLPEKGCIVRQTYIPMLARGEALHAIVDNGPFYDIGTPDDYLRANVGLLRGEIPLNGYQPPADGHWIGQGVRLDGTPVLRAGTSIGDRATIRGEVCLENTVVLPGATVDRDHRNAVICPDNTVLQLS